MGELKSNIKMEAKGLNFYYGSFQALKDINIKIMINQITALIGPSGCGKTTFLRCLNRMNDLVEGVRAEGQILLDGKDIYSPEMDSVQIPAALAWSSRNQTLSPRRFSRTSPMG